MSFKHLTIADYDNQYFSKNTPHLLLDVRTASEFKNVRLPNAVNIPLDELQQRLSEVSSDLPIVVICASGNRSQIAAQFLSQSAYSNVFNLQGGTMTWMLGMRQVERG